MKFLLVFVGVVCLLLGRFSGKNWRTPAAIYSIMWVFFCVVPSCLLWTDLSWNYYGLLWIELSSIFFSIGQAIGCSNGGRVAINSQNKGVKTNISYDFNTDFCRVIIIGMFVLCGIHIIKGIHAKGFSLAVFVDLDKLLSINEVSAYNRYYGDNSTSLVNQLFLVLEYCLPLVGGFCFSFFSLRKEKLLCVLSLVPVFLSLIISNAKAGFIESVMGFAIMYVLGGYIATGKRKKVSLKIVKRLVVISLLFLTVLFVSMCLRIGSLNSNTVEIVRDKFLIYAFGHMKAFDEWFSLERENLEFTFGTMTYNWIFNLLGIVERKQGVYGLASSIHSNVYTFFRGIISDFGSIGGIVYIFIRGVVAGLLYKRIDNLRKISPLCVTLEATTYIFFMYGFISPWTYSTFVASYFLFVVVLFLCNLREREVDCFEV